MKVKLGERIKLQDRIFRVKYVMDDYILLVDVSESVDNGGGVPIMAKIKDEKIKLLTDKNEIKPILNKMLTKMLTIPQG